MPPRYPTSPKDKILRRFYEPLVLLSILDRSRDVIKPDLISDRGLNEQDKLWRDFLDQSSFLCDSAKGGDTVTSIAAQKTYEQSVFWLASNSNSCVKAQVHYQWILSCLGRLCSGSSTETETENEIFERCISFSSKRIKTYVPWLNNAIEKAKCQKKDLMTPEDESLFVMLQNIQTRMTDDRELCTFAYTCRSDASMHVLFRRHNAQDRRNVWSEIRHFIGRLGMWTKAVKILVRGALKFPRYIENAKVETISPKTKADIPNASHLDDLAGLTRRLLSPNEAAMVETLTKALTDMDKVGGIWERFCEKYANISPRPHAELLNLEKFHHETFEFVNDDRYIGCSKPSCYCCHLYIQFHPGRFTPRPCHGNLWLNWAPPIALPSGGDGGVEGRTSSRLQDHPSFKILQQMLVSIRQDLQDQILSRRPKRQKHPDSSTGMSSVAAAIQRIDEGFTTSLPIVEERSIPSSSGWASSEAGFPDEDDAQPSVAPDGVTSEDMDLLQRPDGDGDSEDEDILVFKGRQLRTS